VCAGCSVLEECRDYALRTRQPYGVWGGLDEEQRRALWRSAGVPVLSG
jgi:WhiB family redox-sensing transcriptional regulator